MIPVSRRILALLVVSVFIRTSLGISQTNDRKYLYIVTFFIACKSDLTPYMYMCWLWGGGGGGTGGSQSPASRTPFSRLPYLFVPLSPDSRPLLFLPLSCKSRCLTPYSDSIRSGLALSKIKICVVKIVL